MLIAESSSSVLSGGLLYYSPDCVVVVDGEIMVLLLVEISIGELPFHLRT